uniref:SH3 domain-containing protein n=1 Tax=Hanusia phi TaxID=3032 RepID=A0A6T7T5G8_9CRYP|mmetsp:Transcript_5978/g.13820  ORF Transcript_5978/g.13820 Transcript_5978/m.13820 type:complete len:499 (+) Transcript_5978:155-1651(+)
MDYGNIGDEGGLVRKPYSIKDFDDGGKPCQGMLWDSLYSSRRGDEATFGQGEAMSYRGDMDVEIAGMHTHIAKVVVAHQATAPNQISLQMGELVEVQTGNGAWSLGRVLNEDRKGARDGWFPTFCISSLTENLMHESSTVPLPSESDLISASFIHSQFPMVSPLNGDSDASYSTPKRGQSKDNSSEDETADDEGDTKEKCPDLDQEVAIHLEETSSKAFEEYMRANDACSFNASILGSTNSSTSHQSQNPQPENFSSEAAQKFAAFLPEEAGSKPSRGHSDFDDQLVNDLEELISLTSRRDSDLMPRTPVKHSNSPVQITPEPKACSASITAKTSSLTEALASIRLEPWSLKGPKKVGPNDPTREELLGPLPSAHTQTFVRQRKSDISAYAHEKKDSADAQRCFKARHMSHSFSEPMRRQGNPLTDLHALVSSSKILLHQEELFPNASFSAKSRGRSHSVGIDYQRVRSDMAEVSLQDSKKSAVKDLGETELYPSFML